MHLAFLLLFISIRIYSKIWHQLAIELCQNSEKMSIIFGEKLLHINICQHKCKHFKGLLLSQVSNIVKSRLVSLVETQNKFQMLQLIVISDCWKICNIALNKKNLHHSFQSLTVASKFGNANQIYSLLNSVVWCVFILATLESLEYKKNLKITVHQIFSFTPFSKL